MKGLEDKFQYKTLKAKYFDSLKVEKETDQTGDEEAEIAEKDSSDRQLEEESFDKQCSP